MTIKKLLLLSCLLLLPLTALGADKPQTYVIKKGDTLWGISEKFLKDPDYWPSLWSNNPFIRNPHLIYPGQKIAIRDGRLEILPSQSEQAQATAQEPETLETAIEKAGIEPQEEITISTMGGATGFVSSSQLETLGTLVDTIDNRLLMATGETVFVEMKNLEGAKPGDRFLLIDVGEEVTHPITGKVVGKRITKLGTVELTQINQAVATGVITSANSEINRGALLLPLEEHPLEVTLKKSSSEVSGYLVDASEGKIALSQNDVIYLDLGEKDGIQNGNLLYITRTRKATDLADVRKDLILPDVLLGTAVVIETHADTSAALVLKSAFPLYRGDRVMTIME